MEAEQILRPIVVVGGTIALSVLVGWVIDRALKAADRRHPETPLWGLLRKCQLPLQVSLVTGVLQVTYEWAEFDIHNYDTLIQNILRIITLAALVWLAMRAVQAVTEASLTRFSARTHDPARVRRARTQLAMIQRIVAFVVVTIAVAVAMLVMFPGLEKLGTSLLASAGAIGIIAGVAAQALLGNLFAGLQIAFGSSVKIGDTVVVEGEMGVVEEMSLAFLTIRIWDDRRLTMPVSYFNSKPYENWSRGGTEITGTVLFQLDHAAPVPLMREKLADLLMQRTDFDGRSSSLVVTGTTPTTIEVRAAMTAKHFDDAWTLQCGIREDMIAWLHREHPYALPKVATGAAAPVPAPRAGEPKRVATPAALHDDTVNTRAISEQARHNADRER